MAIAKLRVTVAPSPPPINLHNRYFSFLLSITVILREITNNAYDNNNNNDNIYRGSPTRQGKMQNYAKSWGANKVYNYLYGRCAKAIILIVTVVKLL